MNHNSMSSGRRCSVCGLPESGCRLIRLKWIEERRAVPGSPPRIAVAKVPTHNDVLVCEACIRDIKRLPFSELAPDPEVPF